MPSPNTDEEARCDAGHVRRTVWDGSRELWEIQMYDDPADATVRENDQATPDTQDPMQVYDFSQLWGIVGYTHGPVIDQPLAVHRLNYSSHRASTGGQFRTWANFTLVPLWTFRGKADNGSFGDGSRQLYHPSDPSDSVRVQWPAGWWAYKRTDNPSPGAWFGTLLTDKRDAAGTHYRRNRYYDPTSGQFTQEDPIGLAGGLNLYGFANGDPVNFSDPFGLRSDTLSVLGAVAQGFVSQCRSGSDLCDRVFAALEKEAFLVEVSTGNVGGPNSLFCPEAPLACMVPIPGGDFKIIIDPNDFAAATAALGITVRGDAVAGHEPTHVRVCGSGSVTAENCARAVENLVREQLGLAGERTMIPIPDPIDGS